MTEPTASVSGGGDFARTTDVTASPSSLTFATGTLEHGADGNRERGTGYRRGERIGDAGRMRRAARTTARWRMWRWR